MMSATAQRHTQEIMTEFSPIVAGHMLAALSAFTEATLNQCREGKDSRDCILSFVSKIVESDNMSTILAKEATDTIMGKI